jgi:tetratricopeptide (TPR) repeat protein
VFSDLIPSSLRTITHLAVYSAVRTALAGLLIATAGCALFPAPPAPKVVPAVDPAIQPRTERALANLADGLKRYEAGNFEEAKTSFLLAVDSGVLSAAQQLDARKHMAFIYALQNRDSGAREEFEKAFAIDPKFELTAAEAGHPTWGPIYRQVKADVAARNTSWFAPKPPTQTERLFSEGMIAYDAGDYVKAIQLFTEVQKETLALPDRIKTHKQTAFSYCLLKKRSLCSTEFTKLLKIQPSFELSPAEAGHPSWGTTFRATQTAYKLSAKEAAKDASRITSNSPKK